MRIFPPYTATLIALTLGCLVLFAAGHAEEQGDPAAESAQELVRRLDAEFKQLEKGLQESFKSLEAQLQENMERRVRDVEQEFGKMQGLLQQRFQSALSTVSLRQRELLHDLNELALSEDALNEVRRLMGRLEDIQKDVERLKEETAFFRPAEAKVKGPETERTPPPLPQTEIPTRPESTGDAK